MTGAELLGDSFERIKDLVVDVAQGLGPEQLAYRPDADANSIGWLLWHLTHVQDDHVAGAAGIEQVWTSRGWLERFDLPLPPLAHGYGQSSEDVGKVRVASADLLTGYHEAVFEQTERYVAGLRDADFDRVVDEAWDPPVTLGVRLVSVIVDDLQHVGQAAYLKGLIERRS